MPIFYSLGNFAFGSFAPKCGSSIIARLVYKDEKLARMEAVGLDVLNRRVKFNPQIADERRIKKIAEELSKKSEEFGTRFEVENNLIIIRPPQ